MQSVQQNYIEPQLLAVDETDGANTDVIALLNSGYGRYRGVTAVVIAMAIGFGLGWGCGSTLTVPDILSPTDRLAARSAQTSSGARKTAALTEPRTSVSSMAVSAPKAQASSATIRPPSTNPGNLTPTQVNMTMAAREPLVAVPETKPTTIEGWTIIDVRGNNIVLAGPDGVRTVSTGDNVPGVGRIDSVVRWGNRWIVATASGLIATP